MAQTVVQDSHCLGRDALAELSRQEGGAAVDGVTTHRLKDVSQERARSLGIKDHRNAAGPNLASAQLAQGPLRRFPAHGFRALESCWAPCHRIPVVTLHRPPSIILSDRRGREGAVGRAIAALEPQRVCVDLRAYACFE